MFLEIESSSTPNNEQKSPNNKFMINWDKKSTHSDFTDWLGRL